MSAVDKEAFENELKQVLGDTRSSHDLTPWHSDAVASTDGEDLTGGDASDNASPKPYDPKLRELVVFGKPHSL